MSKHVKSYFDSKFDKATPVTWRKSFKFSMKKIPNKNRADFRRAIRADFAIAKADIIINAPVDSGKLVNNLVVGFEYKDDMFLVKLGERDVKYFHYQNSGSQLFTGNVGFATDALSLFDSQFSQLVEEYKK